MAEARITEVVPRSGLLCYCRAGFESDLAAELTDRAAALGIVDGHVQAARDAGFVQFHCGDESAQRLADDSQHLIFARQRLSLLAELRHLPTTDRIGPIRDWLQAHPPQRPSGQVWVEHPDSDAGKPLSALARGLENALRGALRRDGLLTARDDTAASRLHLTLLAGDHALLSQSDPASASAWPMGIPRLKMHAQAPSRSALKLEEALLVLLDDGQRQRCLRAGTQAADLGAAPGGWTWVLTRHGLRVTAIDNGPLDAGLLASGLVRHVRADGFRWQPPQPVDWMVCDMVEQPIRVASRMAEWFAQGWCRHAIFNLKLPMKKRWQETRRCLQHIHASGADDWILHARQLYHDREEITVFAARA